MQMRAYAWLRQLWDDGPESAGNSRTLRKRRCQRTPRFEPLESRALLTVGFRSVSGQFNNPANPEWGSTDEPLLRVAPADYADGVSAPAGADQKSAREISNLLAAAPVDAIFNDRHLSAMTFVWGQFIDHDIDLTPTGSESLPIGVPAGDDYFDPQGTGTQTIAFSRSTFDPATGTSSDNPRQQLNAITAFIDGSQIYGSDPARAAALRTFFGGRLKTSAGDMLPYNTPGLPNDNPMGNPTSSLFLAGDVRANENLDLTAMHTLFVREHNRLADELASAHSRWTDELIYQQARRIVIGELQAITYNEFLPALLGPGALGPYQGYRLRVNPGIATEFSTAAYRLGHSMLSSDVKFMDNSGTEMHEGVELRGAFFNPELLQETGIDVVLKYLASDAAQEIDNQVVDEVRNFLFGPPGAGGFDLASLNVQRGRDHGLAGYNATRAAYGLKPVKSFAEITSDPELQNALAEAYGNVDNVELWTGGLAEDHAPGASVGPLFRAILVDQFERLRAGDRFWYERDLPGRARLEVRQTTLADVIRRNTQTWNLQDNVFYFYNSIEGTVFADADADGRQDRGEQGMSGMTVELRDADGNLVASALTSASGHYAFDGMAMGVYQVQVAMPPGMRQTTPSPGAIDMTRGEEHSSVDFGATSTSTRPPSGFDRLVDRLRHILSWTFWVHGSHHDGAGWTVIDAGGPRHSPLRG